MPSLNYADQFAPLVESGRKRQSIRALRKRPFKAGDILYHFHGLRHPGSRRLGYSIAEEVTNIEIFAATIFLDRRIKLDTVEEEVLAAADGFDSVDAFYDWFYPDSGGYFTGQLIKWPTICPPFDPDDLELSAPGWPLFLHSPDCPGYCDFACNPYGIDQAKIIARTKGLRT